jgi:hypothetical protein
MDGCGSDIGRCGSDDGIDGPIKEDVLGRKVALSTVNNCYNTAYNGSGGSNSSVEQPAVVISTSWNSTTITTTITNKFYKSKKASAKCRHPTFPL